MIVAVVFVQTRNALAQPRSFPSFAAIVLQGERGLTVGVFLRSDLKRSCAVTFVPALLRIFEMFLNQRMRIFCLRRRFYVSRLPKNDKKYIRILDYLRAVL